MDFRKALLVAKWEFLTTITRRMYILAVIAMPVFYGGMIAVAGFTGRAVSRGEGNRAIAIVDGAHVLDLAFARQQAASRERGNDLTAQPGGGPPQPITEYPDNDSALADLRLGKVSTVFVIEPDYLASGGITAYERDAEIGRAHV